MSSCRTEIIYQNEEFVFTKCTDCGRMGLMYKQAMISFDELNFNAFCRYMERMEFDYEKYSFFDGHDRVVIETYHPDVQFTLLEEEFYRLKANVIEANAQLKLLELIRRM
ncbi:hypothetical protein PBT90_05550 [Algoriphagus halophytocola]|uniref:Uncharacterized protein n=1 Tax=Algoriphagus halophytocola TaxID=2991499 RepID=A0ABY6MKE7_9BACT|nr:MULTISPECIES: DUF6686 family protein [unclassified Algoriphagus]UZD22882.1 hypothetical protein OM944_00005 [Algoriphagus sp. TR-M5]WBL44149.1 hypothetical protein PBT90_05550 [Algoriphagus sp. TR-M9]